MKDEYKTEVEITPEFTKLFGKDGQNFDRLTGKIDLKVYDMMGNLIDDLTTYSIGGPETMQYDMKHRADGIYFFVATGKEGTVAKKVVIRR